jgi:hypothetical protein
MYTIFSSSWFHLLTIVRRSAVFRLAEDADLDDIHIRGDRDAAVVQEWLDEN